MVVSSARAADNFEFSCSKVSIYFLRLEVNVVESRSDADGRSRAFGDIIIYMLVKNCCENQLRADFENEGLDDLIEAHSSPDCGREIPSTIS